MTFVSSRMISTLTPRFLAASRALRMEREVNSYSAIWMESFAVSMARTM